MQNQLQALEEEKAARTPAQQKLESHLLFAGRRARGQQIARGIQDLPSIDAIVKPDSAGRAVVDIRGQITPALLTLINRVGGSVISSQPAFNEVRARIPLGRLEEVAASPDVRAIEHAAEFSTNRVTPERNLLERKPPAPTFGARPPLAERLSRLRALLPEKIRWAASQKLLASRGLMPRLGLFMMTGPLDSEGDVAHEADLARALGINGAGISIGVLSDGVDGLATEQAAGELPAGLTVIAGQAGSGNEGTAMLEIVNDLAPGAALFFATGNGGLATMAANIQALRNAGCTIIIDDLTYFREGVFQDDTIAQAVNTVTASGALYFSSAGNSGNLNDGTSGVWQGDFVNSGAAISGVTGDIHDFGGGATTNVLTQNGGGTRPITLKWSDPLGGSNNDYDLYILNSTLTSVLCAATTTQNGSQDPFESCPIQPAMSRIVIARKSGAAIRALHLNSNRGRLSINTDGQTYGHNAGQNTLSIAAVPVSTAAGGVFVGGATNPVETYSSDGPRRIFYQPNGAAITPGNVLFGTNGGTLLNKVDIAAADCVTTGAAGFSTFCGTSAAAPHAGAVAALLWSAAPASTPAAIRSALFNTALDIEAGGWDRDSGFGIVMALRGLRSLIGFDLSIAKSHSGNFSQGQTGATYSIVVHNGGPAATRGTVTVTDTLPSGLTATALSGTGWTCVLGTLTCTRSDALASGGNYPAITLTVNVSTTAPPLVSNSATVAASLDTNGANNTASDSTVIRQLTYTTMDAATGQYSDAVSLHASEIPVTAGTMEFRVDGTLVASVAVAAGSASYSYTIPKAAGTYTLRADFIPSDPLYIASFGTNTLTVTREDATVTPQLANPQAVKVNTPGGTAGPITLRADIQEVADGSLGDISKAVPVTFTLNPQLTGATRTCTAASGAVASNVLTVACTFTNVAVNLYEVVISIGGNYYQGTGRSLLTVYDPSLGFVTGGGSLLNSTYFANFGFNLKFKKNDNAQGAVRYLQHRPSADVMLKSNAMGPLVVVGTSAIIQGKATLDGVGNYSFFMTVTDNGEPGTSDTLGLKVLDPSNQVVTDLTFNPLVISGGNIQVPQPSGK